MNNSTLKKGFLFSCLLLLFLISSFKGHNTNNYIRDYNPNIIIDGQFDDWDDIPAILENVDTKNWYMNVSEIRIVHDESFLYFKLDYYEPAEEVSLHINMTMTNLLDEEFYIYAFDHPDYGTELHIIKIES
ncbi:MAG: hypothetical protein ACXAC7_13490, partial [Candidatus Hodarchaeales archaeon]